MAKKKTVSKKTTVAKKKLDVNNDGVVNTKDFAEVSEKKEKAKVEDIVVKKPVKKVTNDPVIKKSSKITASVIRNRRG